MLKEIYIENLAVIKNAVIPLEENFNVFTGETGAGKSILINGINAVLGQRVTKDIVRTGSDKAVITALFTGLSESVEKKLDELGIRYSDDEITITREISADGGSVARINNRTSTVSVLRELGELLINIHGQHDNQILLSPDKHTSILDSFGGDSSFLLEYKESFKNLQSAARKLSELKASCAKAAQRRIYLETIVEEIKPLELEKDEDIELEEEYNMLRNSTDIIKALVSSEFCIDSDGDCVVDMLNTVESHLESISDVYPTVNNILERLSSIKIELSDICSELSHCAGTLEIDDETFDFVSRRYELINSLKKKYSMELNDIITLCEESDQELYTLENSTQMLAELENEKERFLLETTEKAKKLYSYREETANRFIQRVTEELTFLDMPNVVLEVKHEKGKLSSNGMDSVEFLISANKGETPKSISKIASGGELSRIMLALKTVIADKDDIPTLIFDEIDTGVSGRAAQKIGIKLQEISEHRQVLCVTHLPQMAVMADNHLLIKKETVDGRTVTDVIRLDDEGRAGEVARIMSGENPSELMMQNAREQLMLNKRK
ncbi:MAG: DNA repair protein RecN [Oscillospiraceae bacterium]|nr:DNA repair protein RecN [Oscillospiraceae bacterium]